MAGQPAFQLLESSALLRNLGVQPGQEWSQLQAPLLGRPSFAQPALGPTEQPSIGVAPAAVDAEPSKASDEELISPATALRRAMMDGETSLARAHSPRRGAAETRRNTWFQREQQAAGEHAGPSAAIELRCAGKPTAVRCEGGACPNAASVRVSRPDDEPSEPTPPSEPPAKRLDAATSCVGGLGRQRCADPLNRVCRAAFADSVAASAAAERCLS